MKHEYQIPSWIIQIAAYLCVYVQSFIKKSNCHPIKLIEMELLKSPGLFIKNAFYTLNSQIIPHNNQQWAVALTFDVSVHFYR